MWGKGRAKMKGVLVTTIFILGLALAVTIINRNDINTDLKATQNALISTEEELNTTKTELVASKQALTTTQDELKVAQQTSTNLKAKLSTTQKQLEAAQETLDGLGITLSASAECWDVDLIDNPDATNPTWNQLMTFLSQDKTDAHVYIEDVYDCSQFSQDLHNNAEAAGIRAAEVQIKLKDEHIGHALNAFLTTNYGLVYVDCSFKTDRIAHVKTGKEYRAVRVDEITKSNIRNDSWWDRLLSGYYYIPSSRYIYIGGEAVETTTSSIKIYW
jgi:hypothetical protein